VSVTIEKIRGEPLPAKSLAVIQSIGWMLMLPLFIAVTWQDVLRLVLG
jgi:membrane-associated protease RseP (regulator of RpoE activity)